MTDTGVDAAHGGNRSRSDPLSTDTAHAASGISVSRPEMLLIIEVLREGESELHQLQQTNPELPVMHVG